MSSSANISEICEALLAASLPIDPNSMESAAIQVADYYENGPEESRIPAEEISDRFGEMWSFWLENYDSPSKELKDVISAAVGVDHGMEELRTATSSSKKNSRRSSSWQGVMQSL